jgi:glycerol uptake facilitator protein
MLLMRGLPAWAVGEFVGTFILVFFGCGSVCAAVTTGAEVGVFQVAIVWGMGIATAIYVTAALSGAHLNPAVTISLAAWGNFPRSRVLGYISTQVIGAFVAAAVLYLIFGGAISEFEAKNKIVRGQPGSEASAMVFGEFFPNPGAKPLRESSPERMSPIRAFFAEVVGTAMLLFVIFCTTDSNNKDRPQILTAATIGLTVTMLISLLGPLTMACFNPARDFGPRLFSSLVGWGGVPFSANGMGWLTVYIVAPILGGLIGGGVYRGFFQNNYTNFKHSVITEKSL